MMSKAIAFLSVAACLGVAALPNAAAAADYYDGGDRPLAFHSRDDVYIDGGRARVEHSQDLRPAYRGPRGPGPVVFDERGPERFEGRPAYDAPRFAPGGYAYGRPAAYTPSYGRFYGGDGVDYRPVPAYRAAALPEFDDRYGRPEVGCTIEQAQSTTPYGWRKIVTHRTCYRR